MATSAGSEFARELLTGAHSELMNCRKADKAAAGLVISQDILAAEAAYQHLTQVLKARTVLVVSTEFDAHARLKAFTVSDDQWLVSVAMVSEGVNIPRLKVLAYLSNYTTELSFDQAVGRITRVMPGRADQRVLVHLPKFAPFEKYASVIEIARNHVIKRKSGSSSLSEPREPLQRFCSQCGESSPKASLTCESCGHEFPTRSVGTGAVVLSSSGFQDGLTLNGHHYREEQIDAVITHFCRTATDLAELRRTGRTVWSGWRLDTLAELARVEGVTLDEKILKAAGSVVSQEVPNDARYAGTPRALGLYGRGFHRRHQSLLFQRRSISRLEERVDVSPSGSG
jgi:hypothetical protein